MQNYMKQLEEMGIAGSRTEDLAIAMDRLVSAICKLDQHNLRIFATKFSLIGHMDLYCRIEDTRNVAQEMHKISLKRDETLMADFERLVHLVEAAAEIGIPGAKQLHQDFLDFPKSMEAL